MQTQTGVLYWAVSGALVGSGSIGLMTIGSAFVVVGLVMAVVGAWRPGTSGARDFLVGFGGLPALVFVSHVVEGLRTASNPYCARSGGPGMPIPPGDGPVECAFIPVSYYVMFLVSAAIISVGLALGSSLRRRFRAPAA